MNRNHRAAMAQETLKILENGSYRLDSGEAIAESGRRVPFRQSGPGGIACSFFRSLCVHISDVRNVRI